MVNRDNKEHNAKAKKIFPGHIYDPLRIEIASDILTKELNKILPTVGNQALSEAVSGWWSNPAKFSLAEVIDFWDAVDATLYGIKLKNLGMMLSAENAKWSKTAVKIDDILLLSKLNQLKRLNDLPDREIPLLQVRNILNEDKAEKTRQLQIIEKFSKSPSQNDYRITGHLTKSGKVRVQDGNRRALRALLLDKKAINAWVYEIPDIGPRNYWVPISAMLSLVKIYRHNKGSTDLVKGLRTVLGHWFSESEVAKIAYKYRIMEWDAVGAKELAKGLL